VDQIVLRICFQVTQYCHGNEVFLKFKLFLGFSQFLSKLSFFIGGFDRGAQIIVDGLKRVILLFGNRFSVGLLPYSEDPIRELAEESDELSSHPKSAENI